MALVVTPLEGAQNTQVVKAIMYVGGDRNALHVDRQNPVVHLCNDWYLDGREIRKISRYSVFAGMRKGKKKGVGPFKHYEKVECSLHVIAVEKNNGWLFFCDSEDNYLRLKESLKQKKLPDKLRGVEKEKKLFFMHVGVKSSYARTYSHQEYVGDKWIDPGDDMLPHLEGVYKTVYETEYVDEFKDVRGDFQQDKSQCICAGQLNFNELYNFLKKVQIVGEERKRAEAQVRRQQKEAERLERERQEEERRKQEEAEHLERERQEEIRWNQKKREKTEQLRLARLRKTPEQLQEERQRRDMGRRGEQEVDYVIEWLAAKGFHSVPKKHCVKYDDETIFLWNPEHIDEPQEYDHIVIGRKGVFLIETKNYRGKLIINPGGNWIREVDGVEEGIISPVQQIGQHKQLLQSILPEGIPIFPVICIAHPKAIIEGAKNCTVPLKKSDVLGDYIESKDYIKYKEKPLCDAQVQECLDRIEHYRLG